MKTNELLSKLDITDRTLRRWTKELGWERQTDWSNEKVDFLLTLRDRLNQLPRVSLKDAVAELTGEDPKEGYETDDEVDLSLEDKITQQYIGGAMALGKRVADNFARVLDMSVYSELNAIYSSGKVVSKVEKGLKRQFQTARSDRELLRLLPDSVDVDLIEAELLDYDPPQLKAGS